MKFIEKFLIKRCSTEVQIMLVRMKDRPEDFDYGTGWRKLVEVADNEGSPYTKTERKMIRKYWKGCEYARKRKELLGRIMSETINPTTRESLEDAWSRQYTTSLVASMHNTTQVLRGGIVNTSGPATTGYTDARALYGQYGKNTIQHGLHP